MKILCIQLRQMGDVMMTTPAVRQLRMLFPKAEIVFMSEPLGANVYQNNPYISKLWVVPRKISFYNYLKLLWQVRKEQFDLTIDFFSNPKSAQIAFASRAKRRIGFDFRGRGYAYTDKIQIPMEVEYAAQAKNALIAPLGGEIANDKIEFAANQQAKLAAKQFATKHHFENRTIAFCVVSRREYKLLPSEFFAKVGRWLIEQGYKLYFLYGPNEKHMAQTVYSLLENADTTPNMIIDYEMPDIQESREILEFCKAYIGTDGGNKHLGICANIPTLTIFNVVQARNWTPPNNPKHRAIQADNKTVDEIYSEFLENFKDLI